MGHTSHEKSLLVIVVVILALFGGCAQKNPLEQAQDELKSSEQAYQKAVAAYNELIKQGKDLDKLYFALGKAYYEHADFSGAQEAFKKSNDPQAKKYTAFSYYRMGDFVNALDAFTRNDFNDDEYLYYHGLTCEKLNLFDQAIITYKKIQGQAFASQAELRIEDIEKNTSALNIKDKDPEVYKIIASAPEAKLYPQAGALILYCDEKIETSRENTQVSYLHYIIKILNERGKEDYSEIQVGYDSTFEKVELEYARTIKPDGLIADVGSRHIRDVSRYLNFPLYSNARVFIISFPEIAEGAVIEYKVKIYNNQLIDKKHFALGYFVQDREPVIAANLVLSLPKERALHIKTLNEAYNDFGANLKPEIEEKSGFSVYKWHFLNIPQIIPESNMPPEAEINPALLISTFDSWEQIYKWWQPIAKDKMQADSAIKEKVKELTNNKTSDEEKIRAIHNFCAKDIRYVAVEYGQAGYVPHKAQDIFRNKYGDCKDQAILLCTMLRDAGYSAWPLLIATKGSNDLKEDFPSILFNHCIACIQFQDRLIFLDPTAQTCSFDDLPAGDQGRKVLIFQDDNYKIQETPLYPAEHNLSRRVCKMAVNSDATLNAEVSIFTYGNYDQRQRYWLLFTQPELIKERLGERIQQESIGAKLEDYKIENLEDLNKTVTLRYSFWGPEYFILAGKLRIMPQLTGIDSSLVAKQARKYALDFDILDAKEQVFQISIPKGLRVKYLPDNIVEDSPWLKFSAEYASNDGQLYFKQRSELKKITVSAQEYTAFKNFFEGIAKKIKQRVVLEALK